MQDLVWLCRCAALKPRYSFAHLEKRVRSSSVQSASITIFVFAFRFFPPSFVPFPYFYIFSPSCPPFCSFFPLSPFLWFGRGLAAGQKAPWAGIEFPSVVYISVRAGEELRLSECIVHVHSSHGEAFSAHSLYVWRHKQVEVYTP